MWREPWELTGDPILDYYIQKARDYPKWSVDPDPDLEPDERRTDGSVAENGVPTVLAAGRAVTNSDSNGEVVREGAVSGPEPPQRPIRL